MEEKFQKDDKNYYSQLKTPGVRKSPAEWAGFFISSI